MSLIIGEDVSKFFGNLQVLNSVSFHVDQADAIGLAGANGEGKTTLLRIIAGLLEESSGEVHRARGLRIGYLPQDPPPLEDKSVREACLEVFSDIRRMEDELHELAAEMARSPGDGDLLKRYGGVQSEFEARGGFDYHRRVEEVLTGLAIPDEVRERTLSTLSGGQRTLTFLATLLLGDPDVLLLDEPTNHLDIDSVEWLEGWLGTFRGALIVVSHDRYFLDRVTKHTWEVAFGALEAYRAPYSGYLVQRDERHKERMRVWEIQQEHIAKTQEFIRIHLAGQRSKEAKGRRTRLERFMRDEAIERPREHKAMNISLRAPRRAGDIVLRAEGLSVGYDAGKPLVEAETLEVERGDRVAIVGPNGAGKTTLIRTLLGELEPLAGAVRLGANVTVSYLSQTHANLDGDVSALDAVLSATKGLTTERARSLLGSLLISGEDVYKRVGELSGGQRSRVALARLVVQSASLLMVDEPTNHLDIPSTEILQDVLRRFDGTILFVSHDRYLIQAVATRIWAIDRGEVRAIAGTWEDYLQWRCDARGESARKAADRGRAAEVKADYRQARRRVNQLQRLKRRQRELEDEIQSLEDDLAMLSEGISAAGQHGNVDLVSQLGRKYTRVEQRLGSAWSEWERLTEDLK